MPISQSIFFVTGSDRLIRRGKFDEQGEKVRKGIRISISRSTPAKAAINSSNRRYGSEKKKDGPKETRNGGRDCMWLGYLFQSIPVINGPDRPNRREKERWARWKRNPVAPIERFDYSPTGVDGYGYHLTPHICLCSFCWADQKYQSKEWSRYSYPSGVRAPIRTSSLLRRLEELIAGVEWNMDIKVTCVLPL